MLDKPTETPPFRLTSLAHGGGCGCKLAPSVLRELLAEQPAAGPFEKLLVGTETGDDAAVYQLDDDTCLIATTDFFMPMVDDPYEFGRIAATNAISDVYAMGGKPLLALAILGMPLGKLAPEMVREILKGGASIAAEAGIPVAGGHSIDAPEPIYGLAVIGTAKPENIRKNSTAKAGDALILTKPLGVGIYSAAFKKEALPKPAYEEMIGSMTLLNRIGAELGKDGGCACGHRRHRLRHTRPWAGGRARLQSRPGDRGRCAAGARMRPARWRRRATSPAPRTATGPAMARRCTCPRSSPTGAGTC